MSSSSQKIPFVISLSLHILIVVGLFLSIEKTIIVPAQIEQNQNKEIIEAVMINNQALKEEVARLDAIERRKKEKEQAHQRELVRKEQEAKEKREAEESLALELKKQNEELKKQAELQKIAQEKQEKERVAKLKAQEEELKKIQLEKEKLLAEKKKAEEAKKVADLAKQKLAEENAKQQQKASLRVKQDQITRYAMLMRNKIHQHWRQPLGLDIGGFTCKVAVKLLPTGEVLEAAVIQSSGNVEFDRSTELAIRKASPLPMPDDPATAQEFRQFTFTFHPEAA